MKTDSLLVCNHLSEYISSSRHFIRLKNKFHSTCGNETTKNTWLVTVEHKKIVTVEQFFNQLRTAYCSFVLSVLL